MLSRVGGGGGGGGVLQSLPERPKEGGEELTGASDLSVCSFDPAAPEDVGPCATEAEVTGNMPGVFLSPETCGTQLPPAFIRSPAARGPGGKCCVEWSCQRQLRDPGLAMSPPDVWRSPKQVWRILECKAHGLASPVVHGTCRSIWLVEGIHSAPEALTANKANLICICGRDPTPRSGIHKGWRRATRCARPGSARR